MLKITVKDLIQKCNATLINGNEYEIINECFVDSKKVKKGSCFFGIKGENIDGSSFYEEAFNNGASICVLNERQNIDLNNFKDKTILFSKDVKKTLQKLALYKRSLFKGTVIGITGSIGKTRTKERLSNILEKKYKVLKTLGNENSQIGLPLTILRLKDEQVMILEMGMSKKNEMHKLSLIAKPNISVITNVLDSHIGNLGSRKNILKAKLEIMDGMNNGTLIINNDNDLLNKYKNKLKDKINLITYGIDNKSDINAINIKEGINTYFDIEKIKDIKIFGGKTFIYNALATYAISKILNIEDDIIIQSINNYSNIKHRLEVISLKNNITIIDDCYNASYDSVKAALKLLSMYKRRKIAILADILEIGKDSKSIHNKIGNVVFENKIDILITIGNDSKEIGVKAKELGMKKENIKHFENLNIAKKYVKNNIISGDVVLIKGSNGMNLISLVEYLK